MSSKSRKPKKATYEMSLTKAVSNALVIFMWGFCRGGRGMNYPTLKDGTRDWCKTCIHDEEPECVFGDYCTYKEVNGDYDYNLPPTHYRDEKETNADRILAMTDEELAATEMLCPYWASKEPWSCPEKYEKRKDGKKGYDCVACVLDWLKAPVEVNT